MGGKNDFLLFYFFVCLFMYNPKESVNIRPASPPLTRSTDVQLTWTCVPVKKLDFIEPCAVIARGVFSLLCGWVKEDNTTEFVRAGACRTVHLAKDPTKNPAFNPSFHICLSAQHVCWHLPWTDKEHLWRSGPWGVCVKLALSYLITHILGFEIPLCI